MVDKDDDDFILDDQTYNDAVGLYYSYIYFSKRLNT